MSIFRHTDVYKWGHMDFYKDAESIYSYMEARSSDQFSETVFFGLQYYVKEYLMRGVTDGDIAEFDRLRTKVLGEGLSDAQRKNLEDLRDLGYLPLRIKAVPEGEVVGVQNVLLTVETTDPRFPWLGGLVESLLLKLWNTCSVATTSKAYYDLFEAAALQTGAPMDFVPFQVHDFGYRGCSSEETAELGGAAHLIYNRGTDTVPAVRFIEKYYGCAGLIGASVPATEHSVACSFGPDEGEEAYLRRVLDVVPEGIVSVVSDTYDYWKFICHVAPKFREEILAREGKVVFRPDSGNPEEIIPLSIESLMDTWGYTVNEKGFRVLNPKVGLIYGDGMYYERVERVLDDLVARGLCSSNLVIGVGGLLLQQHSRDDMGFAFKATEGTFAGETRELFKDPATDPGKKSKKGRMVLNFSEEDGYHTADQVSKEEAEGGYLEVVFENGKLVKEETFDAIRERATSGY